MSESICKRERNDEGEGKTQKKGQEEKVEEKDKRVKDSYVP